MKVLDDIVDGFRSGVDWLAEWTPVWAIPIYATVLVAALLSMR